MIRPFTLIAALMFVFSGAYLFEVKHRSQILEDQIAATAQSTRMDEQRIRVLQAQWALEVDPSRLAQLSAQFTRLQPMKPDQLVTLAALGSLLPAPGSAAPEQNQEDEMPAMPAMPVVAATLSLPLPPPEAPARAAAPTRLARLEKVEALVRSLPAAHRYVHVRRGAAPAVYAENRPAYSAQPFPPVQSALAPPVAIPQAPVDAQVVPVRAVSATPPVPPMLLDGGGSMLGMAQALGSGGSGN